MENLRVFTLRRTPDNSGMTSQQSDKAATARPASANRIGKARIMDTIRVRYINDDVAAAIEFYTKHLQFNPDLHLAPRFAMLSRGGLRLLLNAPGAGGAGQARWRRLKPGGWNRIQLQFK